MAAANCARRRPCPTELQARSNPSPLLLIRPLPSPNPRRLPSSSSPVTPPLPPNPALIGVATVHALRSDRFFQTTPHDLIKKGLYSAVAVPLHSGIHRRVSYEVAARALGAGGASLRERATHVATSISRATQSLSWKHASTMIHKLPSAHASGHGSARTPGHNEHQAPAEGHTPSSAHTEHPAPGRDQAPPRKSSSQTPLISSSHGASMSSSLSDVHLHSVAIDAPSHDDASHVASSGASANYSPAYVPNVPPNLVVAPHVDAAPAEPCSAEDDSDARAEMQLQNALASGRVVALSAQASTSSEVLEVDWI